MAVNVQLKLGTTDGKTIQAFQELISARMKYLNQTAKQSVLATCIDILKSIKPQTKVAKLSSVKVDVKREGGLYPSYTSQGKKHFPCLRVTGTKQRYKPTETLRFVNKQKITKASKVYRYTNTSPKMSIKNRNYLIVADSLVEAKEFAKRIATTSIRRFAGLAKRAISLLMKKTASWLNITNEIEGLNNYSIQKIANALTSFNEEIKQNDNGGTYTVTISDNLKYAIKAIKGGQNSVNVAFQKALNKVAGNIAHKLGDKNTDFFGNKVIDTPFPELKQRGK